MQLASRSGHKKETKHSRQARKNPISAKGPILASSTMSETCSHLHHNIKSQAQLCSQSKIQQSSLSNPLQSPSSIKYLTEHEVEQPISKGWGLNLLFDPEPQDQELFYVSSTGVSLVESQKVSQDSIECSQNRSERAESQMSSNSAEKPATISKNATKNMGKLLLKYIWMNRRKLREAVRASQEQWATLLRQIKQWRGLNSIGRQLLIENWHADTPSARLFRIASCHFFRCRFRSSLYASHIEGKGQYMSLMGRFCRATGDRSALDSLS